MEAAGGQLRVGLLPPVRDNGIEFWALEFSLALALALLPWAFGK